MYSLTQLFLAFTVFAGALATPIADPSAAPDAEPDFEIGGTSLARRQDYTQNWKTNGNINFTPSSTGYSVTFSGAGDFVVGKGWRTGTGRNISFSGSTTATAGTVLVSIYGWTKNPLIEYYIQEYSNGGGAAQGSKVGSVTVDGSSYDIWKHQQVNQPSIVGTSTFWQYISVRTSKRSGSGSVNTQAHFDAWAKLGNKLGTHDYQVIATEGWGNAAGNSKYTVTGA